MSIKLLCLHEHKVSFSFCRKIDSYSNMKYKIEGWYSMKKDESFNLKENDFISLYCNECDYIYKSETKMNIYTSREAHTLYFKSPSTTELYKENGVKIKNEYYSKDYYIIKNKNRGIIYIGDDDEISKYDYYFSEMRKYKNLYDKEKSKI